MLRPSATLSRMKSTVEMWSRTNSSTRCAPPAASGARGAAAAEQPLRSRQQYEDEQAKHRRVGEAAVAVSNPQRAQHADEEPRQPCPADAGHAADDDHRQAG